MCHAARSSPAPRRHACSLHILAALGGDALLPDPVLGVANVQLLELAIGWDNVYQEVVVRRAGDIFACAAASGPCYDLIPFRARLLWAVFRVDLSGPAPPCLVEIRPPHTLILRPPDPTPIVERWLLNRGFLLASHPT
jgi:hypothetical protein